MSYEIAYILIIEDNRVQAKRWRDYLRKHVPGVCVDVANSADDAIEKFREQQYTTVILDIMMYPRADWDAKAVKDGFWSGIQLHKELLGICKEQGRGEPKLLVVTAIKGARPGLYNGAYEYFRDSASEWFDKPFDPKDLGEKILELLSREDAQSSDDTGDVSSEA